MSPRTGSTGIGGPRAAAAVVTAGALIGGGMFALGQMGLASAAAPVKEKVDICHRTAAANNPYVSANVDTSSTDLNGHASHTGPVFDPENPSTPWGDIIPPFTNKEGVSYPGYNWPAGQLILENGCKIPDPSPSPTPTESPTPTGTPTTPPPPVVETSTATPPPVTIVEPAPAVTEDVVEELVEQVPVAISAPELGTAPAETPKPVSAPQLGTAPLAVPAGGGGEAGR